MIPIENFITCSNKLQKLQRERFFIQSLNGTLNCEIPGKLLEMGEVEYKKQHSKIYREQYPEYYKKYHKDHFDHLKQIANTKFKCKCGQNYIYANKSRHIRTIRHQNYVKINEIISNYQTIITDINKFIFDTNQFIISINQI
jgi:hypothetical protein